MFIVNLMFRVASARFDLLYRSPFTNFESYGPTGRYDAGTFDLGAWACQVGKYPDDTERHRILSGQCVDETVPLWLGLILAVLGVGLAGLVWSDWRGRRILVRDSSDAFDEGYECNYL